MALTSHDDDPETTDDVGDDDEDEDDRKEDAADGDDDYDAGDGERKVEYSAYDPSPSLTDSFDLGDYSVSSRGWKCRLLMQVVGTGLNVACLIILIVAMAYGPSSTVFNSSGKYLAFGIIHLVLTSIVLCYLLVFTCYTRRKLQQFIGGGVNKGSTVAGRADFEWLENPSYYNNSWCDHLFDFSWSVIVLILFIIMYSRSTPLSTSEIKYYELSGFALYSIASGRTLSLGVSVLLVKSGIQS